MRGIIENGCQLGISFEGCIAQTMQPCYPVLSQPSCLFQLIIFLELHINSNSVLREVDKEIQIDKRWVSHAIL